VGQFPDIVTPEAMEFVAGVACQVTVDFVEEAIKEELTSVKP
jgi:hypothetical protein